MPRHSRLRSHLRAGGKWRSIPALAGWAEPLPALPAASEPPSPFLHARPGFGSLWEVGGVPLCHGPGGGGPRGSPPAGLGAARAHSPGGKHGSRPAPPTAGLATPTRGHHPTHFRAGSALPPPSTAGPPGLQVATQRQGVLWPRAAYRPLSASMAGGCWAGGGAGDGGRDLPGGRAGGLRPWGL